MAVTVPKYLLKGKDPLTDFFISKERLLKLLQHVEVDKQRFISVFVELKVWKLVGKTPVDALNKANSKYDYTE